MGSGTITFSNAPTGELAETVRQMTESPPEIMQLPYDQAYAEGFEEMRRRVPDLSKIHGLIGYRPEHDLREILRDVIEHARNGSR